MNELALVVLNRDVIEHGLEKGDVGKVVHQYENREHFEVEFLDADGEMIALLTLSALDVVPFTGRRILHARDLVVI